MTRKSKNFSNLPLESLFRNLSSLQLESLFRNLIMFINHYMIRYQKNDYNSK